MARPGPLIVALAASLVGCAPAPVGAPPPEPPPQPTGPATAPAPRGNVELEAPTIEEEKSAEATVPTGPGADVPPPPPDDSVARPQPEPVHKSPPKKRPKLQTGKPPPRQAAAPQAATSSGGTISPEAIRDVVRGGITEIKKCYERNLQREPELSGKVTASFTIDPTGRVIEVRVRGMRQDLESCLESVIRTWRFPAPKGGGVVRVTYPFVFQSAD